MKPTLGLRTSQQLTLTPQLQQSIRLLQLSTIELAQEIEQALAENPLLEIEEDEPLLSLAPADIPADDDGWQADESALLEDPAVEAESPPDWDGDGAVEIEPNASDLGCDASSASTGADDANYETGAAIAPSLTSHLLAQAIPLRLSDRERVCLNALIDALDSAGFLTEAADVLFAELMAMLGVPLEEDELEAWQSAWATALALLRSMDPLGVGAANVWESLRLQALAHGRSGHWGAAATQTVVAILGCAPELIAKRDIKRLQSLIQVDEASVVQALARIRTLNPRPASEFAADAAQAVTPDVIVSRVGRSWRVDLNPDVVPKLRVGALGGSGASLSGQWQAKQQEARWFTKSVQQRFETILRVSAAIVERQRGFFSHGAVAMQPLVLRDIADSLCLHESTVSRVTTAKFMATPQGTFELKYFFGSSLQTDRGASASSTAVKALIKKLVEAENGEQPLSDGEIAEQLKRNGVNCARRTVAKYREALRIPPANVRLLG